MKRIQQHQEAYFVAMYGVYKATDVMFARESQLEATARVAFKRILEKGTTQNLENLGSAIKSLQDQVYFLLYIFINSILLSDHLIFKVIKIDLDLQ